MKKSGIFFVCSFILLGLYPFRFEAAETKLAQTSMKFLSVPLDARSAALGSALTAMETNSIALFSNPAGMARLNGFIDGTMGQVQWIADINYIFGSLAFRPSEGRYGVIGLTFQSVDYGNFAGTIRAENEQGYLDVGNFSPSAFAVGLGYAKALTDKFSAGGHIKYVNQDLVGGYTDFAADQTAVVQDFSAHVLVFDFGILYRTGFRSLNFGMCVRNFSKEIVYSEESFQLPLTFRIGLSMDMLDIYRILEPGAHSLLMTVDAIHPRDYPEQLAFGAEYVFMKAFILRASYWGPNDRFGASYGLGFKKDLAAIHLEIDYAYTPFDTFGDVHRFTVAIGY